MTVMEQDTFDELVAAVLYRFHCPSVDDLGDYAAGFLTDAHKIAQIRKHLEGCKICNEEIQSWFIFSSIEGEHGGKCI